MIRRQPKSTRTDTLLPYTTLFRSALRIRDILGEARRKLPLRDVVVGHALAVRIVDIVDLGMRADAPADDLARDAGAVVERIVDRHLELAREVRRRNPAKRQAAEQFPNSQPTAAFGLLGTGIEG